MGGLETIGRQIEGLSDMPQFARIMRAQPISNPPLKG
jgi:hypothetical protein